jgi:malate synthase
MTISSTKAKASRSPLPSGAEVLGEITPAFSEVLTPEALAFVAKLQRHFGTRRKQCLERRQERQRRLHQGEGLDFLPETKQIREGDWKCAPIPSDIQDRRVEITGPTDRKMVINALNSGAKIFMADFEDANAPTWWKVKSICATPFAAQLISPIPKEKSTSSMSRSPCLCPGRAAGI